MTTPEQTERARALIERIEALVTSWERAEDREHGGEEAEDIAAELASQTEQAEEIVPMILRAALYWQGLADQTQRRANELQALASARDARSRRLRDLGQRLMEAAGLDRVEAEDLSARVQANGGVLPLEFHASITGDELHALDPSLVNEKVTFSRDRDEVRRRLGGQPGELVIGGRVIARVLPRGRHLRIRG